MKRLTLSIILSLLLLLPSLALGQPPDRGRMIVTEIDGGPTGSPYMIKFSNGAVTDNGDGTFTVVTGVGGGGDVSGGALSVNGELVVYDGVTGKVIKQSGLGAGIVKSSAAAVPSIAVDGTDYLSPTYISDVIFGAGWDADTTHAPSKNAVYDQMILKATLASPTFTGVVTMPTPFTLGATSVTTTGVQLNYLKDATGITGTGNTNVVFSASPTFTGTITYPSPFTLGATSVTTTGVQLNYLKDAAGTTGTATTNIVFSTSPTFVGSIILPSANADPAATAGSLVHDSTVANFTNGALRYYNGAAIKQVIDMTAATAEACTEAQAIVYDATADLWKCGSVAAGNAATITVADTEDATTFVALFPDATGNLAVYTDESLTYVANTGILSATGFTGALNGTVGATTPAAGTFTTVIANAASSLTLGTASSAAGGIILHNATNANHFTITSGVSDAALAWTLPTSVPGGSNYLLNVDADGTMGYTPPVITNFSGNNWKMYYTDGSGVFTEVALGIAGSVLTSNGAAVAPTFATPTGIVLSVGDCVGGACNDETVDGGTYLGLYSVSGSIRLRNNAGVMEARTAADAAYANFKAATFTSQLGTGEVGYIRIQEDPTNGTNFRAFSVASSLAEDLTLTWPTGLPTANDFFVMGTPAAGISAMSYRSLPNLMDTMLGAVQGDILYRSGTAWTVLAPGTSGWVLKTQGAAANPIWAAETASAGGAATNVQYNTGGALDGEAAFTYNAGTDTLTAVNFAGNLVGGLTASSSVIPNAVNTLALGSAAAEWSDLFLGDGAIIYGQNDQSATLTSSASTWTASNFVSSGTTKTTGALSPVVAGATTAGTLLLPYSSVYIGNAATNNIQLTGVGTASRIATFADTDGTVNVSPTVGTADHMYMSTATAGLGKWSTPTYPSASGAAGETLYSDGTNWVILGAGATTTILVGGGAAAPVWTVATGTGAPVRATSPTLVTPLLGTPTSGTLTNCTGLPIATGVSGLAANVATFLATPSSANLLAAVTDETGTGLAVFNNTPTLITPVIGAATGTSLMATGRIDGTTGMLISTAGSATTVSVATHGHASYFMNIGDDAPHSIFTLPTAEAGLQYCFKNYTGITQVLTVQTSAAGQYIDLDGTNTASGGFIHSGGAAGDGACVIGVDATHWVAYKNLGTWTVD